MKLIIDMPGPALPVSHMRIGGRLGRHPPAMLSAAFLLLIGLASLGVPLIEHLLGIDAYQVNLLRRLATPGADHPLGTDEAGRDLLARLLYGGRVSLLIGVATALTASAFGVVIGLAAGSCGGVTDRVLMRLTDGVIALPLLPLLIVLASIDLGEAGPAPLTRLIAIIALVAWPTVARIVRAEVLSLRERGFVRAAEAQGASAFSIARRHLLPNVAAPLVVATTLSIGNIILMESVLSFLGLGIQPPLPSWGNMLTNAQDLIWTAPALAIWPGLMIFLTVMAFNFLGDGLQDALDPRRN